MSILICPLSHLPDQLVRRRPGRVISLLDPETQFPELGPSYIDRHLRLAFHDAHVPEPGVTIPSTQHIAQLFAFLQSWDAKESLLVHCRAGIGRSTATAFIAACHRNPDAPEHHIAVELRSAAPFARPNETLVRLADTFMNRRGKMSTAIADTGRGLPWIDLPEGQPFELPSQFVAS